MLAQPKSPMTKAGISQPPQPFDTVKRQVRAATQRRYTKWRKDILLVLANLRDDGCAFFRRKLIWPNQPLVKDDRAILEFRDHLRRLWRRDKNYEMVLGHWVNICRIERQWTWTVPAWADGTYSVEPNYTMVPLALAIGAGEWMPKMAVCGNPECPAPYFLKKRATQRFCERGPCVEYGQRQHALNWWRRVGAKRRAERVKIQSKRKRKERKRK